MAHEAEQRLEREARNRRLEAAAADGNLILGEALETADLQAINADLLAALKMATDALASDTDEWGSIRHKTEVAQARAAIAKAKT